jgi:hypothetical protein
MNSANQIGEYYQILLTKKKKKKDNQIQKLYINNKYNMYKQQKQIDETKWQHIK